MRRRFSFAGFITIGTICLVLLGVPLILKSGPKPADQVVVQKETPERFISSLVPEAKTLGKAYGVKPSILIAQAALETQYGRSLLGHKYNNLYHLKASQNDAKVSLLTALPTAGKAKPKKASYAVYPDWSTSMAAYLTQLKAGHLGNKTLYAHLANAKTVEDASKVFYQEKYTSDSTYGEQLLAIIKKYKLETYDKD